MHRILGFTLVFAGIGIIGASLFYSFEIFTGERFPPQLFSLLEQQFQKPAQGLGDDLQNLLQNQVKSLLPLNTVPTVLNLSSWSLFAGLLFLGGGQVAGIGIKLLKL